MIQKLKTLIISLSLLLSFSAPVVLATQTASAQVTIHNSLCQGSNIQINNAGQPSSATCPDSNGSNLQTLLTKVINILSVLVGAIAVIMIIVGGFRYVTSAGNEQGVGAAKKTILYALIGLVIVAISQVVVHFVLNNINVS